MPSSPLAELIALISPPACAACRAPLAGAELRVCPACVRALPWLRGRLCPRCALPRHRGGSGSAGGRSGRATRRSACPAADAGFAAAWAPLAYEGVARDLVAALKFRAAVPLADLMAAQIVAGMPPAFREVEAVVP